MRDLSHLGFEVQKTKRWKWAHCPQNKMKSYVDSMQSPLVKKQQLYFIIIWTLENFGRLFRSLSCAKWIEDPRSCVAHNEPLWVKWWCMNSWVSNLDSKSLRQANASPVKSYRLARCAEFLESSGMEWGASSQIVHNQVLCPSLNAAELLCHWISQSVRRCQWCWLPSKAQQVDLGCLNFSLQV